MTIALGIACSVLGLGWALTALRLAGVSAELARSEERRKSEEQSLRDASRALVDEQAAAKEKEKLLYAEIEELQRELNKHATPITVRDRLVRLLSARPGSDSGGTPH